MDISVLLENTTINERLVSEHGLSLLVEYVRQDTKRKMIFDFGQSDAFIKNAQSMGVTLKDVDYGVLSHGHYDHGGGLLSFLELNKKAKVYIHKRAFRPYYSLAEVPDSLTDIDLDQNPLKYVGLNPDIKTKVNIVLVDKITEIDEGVLLVSDIEERSPKPSGNKRLIVKNGESFQYDSFDHEQNLVMIGNHSCVLFAGCAHNGIINIVDDVEKKLGKKVSHVISGLHLHHRGGKTYESSDIVAGLGDYFIRKNIKLYTGHCTGDKAYKHLKTIMGEQLHYLHTGLRIHIEDELKV